VTLPYDDSFSESNIPTKSRPCQMNAELDDFCKKEIDNLLQKGLIKPSKSPWSCTAFYVNKAAEQGLIMPKLFEDRSSINYWDEFSYPVNCSYQGYFYEDFDVE
jgi:hypothetical protein